MKKNYLLLACLVGCALMANAQDRIYWGIPNYAISSAKFDGTDTRHSITLSGTVIDIETDFHTNIIYWGENSQVKKANTNGTNSKTLYTGTYGYIGGIALDLANNKLYFSQFDAKARMLIFQCNLDGTNLDTIVESPMSRGMNYNLTISPTLQKLYWAEKHTAGNSIMRCNLDGTNIEELMTVTNIIAGLAIDEQNQKLYFAYYTDNKVLTTDMTCSTTPTELSGSFNSTQNIVIHNAEGKLYFTERSTSKIRKCNLDGTSQEDFIYLSTGDITGLSIPLVTAIPTILEDSTATFKLNDLSFSGIDAALLTNIKITATVDKGTMYLDANNNNIMDEGEEVTLNQEISKTDIEAGLLKFKPLAGEFGTPYTQFKFKWYNGTSYSTLEYTQYIYVTEYIAGDSNQNGVIDDAEIAGDVNNNGEIDRPTEIAGDRDGNGVIDGSEVAGDINGDFAIVLPELEGDLNGNNILDDEFVGINTINRSDITIYPTVSTGLVSIDGTIRTDVVIYNLTGIEVLRTQSNRVNLRGLQAGMYLLQVNGVTQKIVLK